MAANCKGDHVWGVNQNDDIYHRKGHHGKWEQIPGKLKQISVAGKNGQFVWGVNANDDIYFRHGYKGEWK